MGSQRRVARPFVSAVADQLMRCRTNAVDYTLWGEGAGKGMAEPSGGECSRGVEDLLQ